MDSHDNNSTKTAESVYDAMLVDHGTLLPEYQIKSLLVSASDIAELSGWTKNKVLTVNRLRSKHSFPLPVGGSNHRSGCRLYWSRSEVESFFLKLISGEGEAV